MKSQGQILPFILGGRDEIEHELVRLVLTSVPPEVFI